MLNAAQKRQLSDNLRPVAPSVPLQEVYTPDQAQRLMPPIFNRGVVVQNEMMVHWSAEVFEDAAELKKNLDGTDDLTHERAIEMLIDDVRLRGVQSETPTDPLRDPVCIKAINAACDIGGPSSYPDDVPVTALYLAG